MPWVPFQDVTTEGFGYVFTDEGGVGVGFGGVLELAPGSGDGAWTMDLFDGAGPFNGRCRVTVSSFLAEAEEGETYTPAVLFAEVYEQPDQYFFNDAPPAPGSSWDASGQCVEFLSGAFDNTNVIEFDSELYGPIERIRFVGSGYGLGPSPAQVSFTMVFEIWVEGDEPGGCFWDGIVNAVEDCGGDEPVGETVLIAHGEVDEFGGETAFWVRESGFCGIAPNFANTISLIAVYLLDDEAPVTVCGEEYPIEGIEYFPLFPYVEGVVGGDSDLWLFNDEGIPYSGSSSNRMIGVLFDAVDDTIHYAYCNFKEPS